jgi:lipopolysaccharide transport system ATP-binding protein
MKPIIKVNNLSKRYLIGARRDAPATFRETLSGAVRSPLKSLRRDEDQNEILWALKDVSFEVKPGEVVGIVGRNGAGKSTLLKVLSRITEPTTGRIELFGKIGSLLEVGTGFHPELTGRENIYLNGSILGMSRAEIERKFDEIIAFSEIERFLDTPVKRYSSGMYVRLAFAVAAHLEPEILIVDEVLAVGDISFQKKCLGKMNEISEQGRTVLFVSHAVSAVRRLCPRTIVINEGTVIADGPTSQSLRVYNELMREKHVDEKTNLKMRLARGCSGAVRFTGVHVGDDEGNEKWDFIPGDMIRIEASYRAFETAPDLSLVVMLRSATSGEVVTTVKGVISNDAVQIGQSGTAIVEFPDVCLRPGDYDPYLWLGSLEGKPFDVLDSESVSLPHIGISSNTSDPHLIQGYFSIPAQVTLR